MKKLALIAQKGGTGKTTLAVCLAVAAELAKKRVLIIDFDPQASACKWADRRQGEGIVAIDAQPARLANALKKAQESGIDLTIIDTPGKSEQSALAAAEHADLIIVATRPQIYDLETIPDTKRIIDMAGGKPAIIVFTQVPPPSHEGVSGRYQDAAKAVENYGIPVCADYVCARVDFGDAANHGQSPIEYHPDSRAAVEIKQLYKSISRLLGK